MVFSRPTVEVDIAIGTDLCILIGTMEFAGNASMERSQKHLDHGSLRMCFLCWSVRLIRFVRSTLTFFFFFFFPLANSVGETFIHGSVGSVLGAFVVSLLGNVYTRLWNGYAFPAMVPGVLLLVPTGLTAVGGLAQNYGSNDDQFSSGLNTGLAMIQCKLTDLFDD